jgi:hypothetical protein
MPSTCSTCRNYGQGVGSVRTFTFHTHMKISTAVEATKAHETRFTQQGPEGLVWKMELPQIKRYNLLILHYPSRARCGASHAAHFVLGAHIDPCRGCVHISNLIQATNNLCLYCCCHQTYLHSCYSAVGREVTSATLDLSHALQSAVPSTPNPQYALNKEMLKVSADCWQAVMPQHARMNLMVKIKTLMGSRQQ